MLSIVPLCQRLFYDVGEMTEIIVLTWRPSHLATPHDMDVQVVDRLTPILPVVDDDPVSLGQTELFRLLPHHLHQMTQQLKHHKKTATDKYLSA